MIRLIKPRWWRSLLFIFGIVYLIPEAIFNGQLVSLIGLGTPSAEDLEHLELYGRAISGIGVALLLADYLPVRWVSSVPKAIVAFALLICLVWPVVFYGQKLLIENTLIEPSTPEQRQFAVYSAVLRDALAINAIKINGLDYDPQALHSSENLTFLALFGGLLYSDPELSDNLEQDKRKIIAAGVQKKAYQEFDQHYNNYSQLYDELVDNYKRYVEASKKYNQIITTIPEREQGYWQQVEQQVNDGWMQYQQAQKAHIAKASARAQKYGPKIYDYHKTVSKCQERYKKSSQRERREKCILRASADYRSDILQAGIGYVEPDYWLIVEDISATENAASSLLLGVLSGGVYTALQAVSLAAGGDGGIKDKRYTYTSNPDHYQLRFLQHPNFQAMFEKETGYPFAISDFDSFRSHPQTSKQLRGYFASKDLVLSEDWTIQERSEFAASVKDKVTNEANHQWRSEMKQRRLNLEPNLTWMQFQLHPQIQQNIKEKMGDLYVANIRADLNRKNFKIQVLDPNIQKRTDEYLALLYDSKDLFADGQQYEEFSKQALRSVIIPPISMSISLFLICLTFSKLPLKLWDLVRTSGHSIGERNTKLWGVKLLLKLLIPVLILIFPVLFLHSNFTNNANSPVNYLLGKIDETSNPLFSYAIRWTLHTQPILHPLGLGLEDTFKIYQNFAPVRDELAKIDIDAHPENSGTSNGRQHIDYAAEHKTKVYIQTSPSNATIRIMNIGPKYHPGMILKSGSYDIQVTAPGYKPYRRWHHLGVGEELLNLSLTKRN
jgi:hypothetical protein